MEVSKKYKTNQTGEINEKKPDPPECKKVSAGFLMACVYRTNLLGGQKVHKFRKVNPANGARTVGDWEPSDKLRNVQVIKFNQNYYLVNDKILKEKGTAWLKKML